MRFISIYATQLHYIRLRMLTTGIEKNNNLTDKYNLQMYNVFRSGLNFLKLSLIHNNGWSTS